MTLDDDIEQKNAELQQQKRNEDEAELDKIDEEKEKRRAARASDEEDSDAEDHVKVNRKKQTVEDELDEKELEDIDEWVHKSKK